MGRMYWCSPGTVHPVVRSAASCIDVESFLTCGRLVTPEQAEAERDFNVHRVRWVFDRRFNVAPTRQVTVVRQVDSEREGFMRRWGLIPFFANGEATKYSTINARMETIATSAAYRGPWKRGQRCILPASVLTGVQ